MPRTRFFPVAYKSIRVYFRRAASKITPHGIFIFYANLNSNDALRSRVHLSVSLVFQPLFFFFNRGSKHNFVTYISRCERNVISSFFLYKIPLHNDGSYVRFLSRRRQRTGSSFHYETYLVRVNSLNTISENYVHRYLF